MPIDPDDMPIINPEQTIQKKCANSLVNFSSQNDNEKALTGMKLINWWKNATTLVVWWLKPAKPVYDQQAQIIWYHHPAIRSSEQKMALKNSRHVSFIYQRGPCFLADTTVNFNPTAENLQEITLLVAKEVKHSTLYQSGHAFLFKLRKQQLTGSQPRYRHARNC